MDFILPRKVVVKEVNNLLVGQQSATRLDATPATFALRKFYTATTSVIASTYTLRSRDEAFSAPATVWHSVEVSESLDIMYVCLTLIQLRVAFDRPRYPRLPWPVVKWLDRHRLWTRYRTSSGLVCGEEVQDADGPSVQGRWQCEGRCNGD